MATTLHAMFIESARSNGAKTAYIQRIGSDWKHMTFTEALARVEAIGAGLMDLGVTPGDRAAILSMSRQEWSFADYAILGTGATVVPIYQTNSPGECQYILENSRSSVVRVLATRSSVREWTTLSAPRHIRPKSRMTGATELSSGTVSQKTMTS